MQNMEFGKRPFLNEVSNLINDQNPLVKLVP